jgi:superfamily II DNA or RNA helicase
MTGKLANLRPHQQRALSLLRQSLAAGHRRPMVQAPTGAGKTILAAAMIEGARRKGNRVLVAVPALSLVDQTVEALQQEGLREVGVMQATHCLTDHRQPIQVASIQTLIRRKLPEADFAIIDEAHRWYKYYGHWFALLEWEHKPIIGLSATPWTSGLGKHYDDLIVATTTTELIQNGYLSNFRVFAPSHPDLTGIRTQNGDYDERQISGAMNKSALVADIVQTWLARGENRPTLCFGVDRPHAKNLQQQFAAAGVSTAYIDAFTSVCDRLEIERRFRCGEVKVVCNVGCLTTGVDWDVRCIVLARPTKSDILFVQMIGRGLRTAEGKSDCLILDHSDTHLRLGFVTDIHYDTLDFGRERQGNTPEKRKALPQECPKCSYVKPAKVVVCPACGFKPERQPNIDVKDGDLVQIKGQVKLITAAEKQSFYSQVLGIQQERSYRPGWAAHQYKQKFKVAARFEGDHQRTDPRSAQFCDVTPDCFQKSGSSPCVRPQEIAHAGCGRAFCRPSVSRANFSMGSTSLVPSAGERNVSASPPTTEPVDLSATSAAPVRVSIWRCGLRAGISKPQRRRWTRSSAVLSAQRHKPPLTQTTAPQ